MLGQNVALAVIDFDDVRHVARVDVNGFTRQLRNCGCPTIVGVEEIPDIWVDGSVVDIDTKSRLEDQILLVRKLLLTDYRW